MPQPVTKKRKIGTDDGPTITDPRFANIQSDPRYRLPGKSQRVKVDKRFARALKDEDFTRKARVDRYGREINTEAEKQRLKRRFDFAEGSDDESDRGDDDDEVQDELKRVGEIRDVLREGRERSSTSEESSSDEDSDIDEDVEEGPGLGVQDGDAPAGEVSARLAVVNLDWDNIRAEDLMAVFTSFLPATGRLINVAIYPSEFGKERMEREEMEGPPKEIFAAGKGATTDSDSEEDDEDIKAVMIKPDDGADFDSTALRQYQLDRLRYYYAVLTFSSAETAKSIYDAVDGTEYQSTANFFDLRFIPDETDFSDDKPREACSSIPVGYRPNEFITDALQHSKVKLTWDAEDGGRKEAQARAFRGSRKDIDENDLKAYLASDSDSGENEEDLVMEKQEGENQDTSKDADGKVSKKDAERQRMRALLGLAPEPVKKTKKDSNAPTGNIHITFSSGLAGTLDENLGSDEEDEQGQNLKSKRSVFENSPELEETTAERYIRKEKERKQRRKEKMKASRSGNDPDEPEPEPDKDQPADLGFDDPFFAEPTNDKQTAGKLRKEERLKKRREREAEEAASAKHRAELELLLADDANKDGSKGHTVQHFDMEEILKAEKQARKKGKAGKKNRSNNDISATVGGGKAAAQKDAEEEDDFRINTSDPRFASLFENHEFAIDPTNQRSTMLGQKAIKAIQEEGRRRKNQESNETVSGPSTTTPTTSSRNAETNDKKATKGGKNSNTEDRNQNQSQSQSEDAVAVADLVAKIKRKTKLAGS